MLHTISGVKGDRRRHGLGIPFPHQPPHSLHLPACSFYIKSHFKNESQTKFTQLLLSNKDCYKCLKIFSLTCP